MAFERIEPARRPLWVPNRTKDTNVQAAVDARVSDLKARVSALPPAFLCECHDLVADERRCATLSAADSEHLKRLMHANEWTSIAAPGLLEDFLRRL
jgi:hypothetical protein